MPLAFVSGKAILVGLGKAIKPSPSVSFQTRLFRLSRGLCTTNEIQMLPPSPPVVSLGGGLVDLSLRASNEGLLRTSQ